MVTICAPVGEERRCGRTACKVMKWDSVFVVSVLAARSGVRVSAVASLLGTRGRPVTDEAALLISMVGGPSCVSVSISIETGQRSIDRI